MWERVVFLDPNTGDGFGDIALRYGHSTLVFPGLIEESLTKPSQPTLKEVVVHNEGDIAVTIARGYLSPKPKNRHIAEIKLLTSCELSHFRVLGCRESTGLFPIHLAPGQNRSIFIEHYPQCTKKREYIMFHLELDREDGLSSDHHRSAEPRAGAGRRAAVETARHRR